MPRFNKAGTPTSLAVAEAIERMRDALFTEYGVDYAFAILGRGHVLASSNNENGIIHAVISEKG
jgi:hypothetical protein